MIVRQDRAGWRVLYGIKSMSSSELERLKTLAQFADQISNMAANTADARQGIARLIAKAEQDIRTKSLEIQLQQSHIALLRHLDGILEETPGMANAPLRLNEKDAGAPKVFAPEKAAS